MTKLLVLAVLISYVTLVLAQRYESNHEDNLQVLSRPKRSIFTDVLSTIKTVGRRFVEIDRDVRQALQNKAIEILDSGKYGDVGRVASAGAQRVKEMYDHYDAWKLNQLS